MQPQLPPTEARGPSLDSTSATLTSRPKPSNVAVQSFAAFRAQTSSIPAPSPVRRKPLPANASPIASRFSPPLKAPPRLDTVLSPPASSTQEDFLPRDLDRHPHGHTPLTAVPPTALPLAQPSPSNLKSDTLQRPRHDRAFSSYHTAHGSISEGEEGQVSHSRSPTMPNMPLYTSQTPAERAETQPNLTLQLDGVTSDFLDDDPYSPGPDPTQQSKPKSPGGTTFGSFFGWTKSGQQQNGATSPTTTFSDRSLSPAHSPALSRHHIDANNMNKGAPSALDIPMANSTYNPNSYFNVPGTPLFSSSPSMNAHVEELERELREVSSELAASIAREMELEDEVERYKIDSSNMTSEVNRRTSDYYSDSGASSVRYPIGDSESKLEEVERLRRKAEQDRATLKVSMSERLSDELRRRRDLEEQVQTLEEKVHKGGSRGPSIDESGRVRELESSLEEARRRLAEERQVKENFEDLLTALRQELEQHRNERDNLRDEIVPQLKARVEGLEAESSEVQTLIYESTRMQQEIQSLRNENQTLVNARRMQLELAQQQQQQNRFKAIAEEAEPTTPAVTPRIGLSRSNSLARSSAFNSKRGSLSRSNSVKDRPAEAKRDSTQNPLKEIEEQRDALHRALKSLLHRQEYQAKEYEKRIKALEMERDSAMSVTPRRTAFHAEVKHLRDEVNHLRRRADDALEQKWQCEKGLGGLRMDLDRAQQETSSLRDLLSEHDIFVPERKGSITSVRSDDAVPDSLDKAYNELQTTHALSLARIKDMESEDSLGLAGEEAERTMALLKQSISDAEAERDIAQKEAKEYRLKARALQKSEIEHLGKEQSLSSELYAAATRMDELSAKVQAQLQSNKALRKRLADAISRGELEQAKSTSTIVELERKLKAAEEKVMSAQQSSEESIAKHEEEVKSLKESQGEQLRRAKSGLLSPARFSPTAPVSPMFALRSPKLDKTTSGLGMTMAEATKTQLLETRVQDLEKALSDADREMEEVVGRMNMAQIEVAELQFERLVPSVLTLFNAALVLTAYNHRDEAMRQTRNLQAAILAEREKVKALM
ncbi:uncharacterized protein BDZ99DRAFT_556909 [Mytilinidion resinicola]|uniref:DUF7603 domain-containing protein n=1 Tax=Mytilinidion resinicola TaxID=574789 RepID=A0A6A6YXS1_9PEZI|nr:uncharacterized protein BDZ99DRAFT_556909 [Mytilinidion resinicola]KAF2813358.1 hypothetical protein BDZ99DRAFT_556909 [Mytilinidion resinicola]